MVAPCCLGLEKNGAGSQVFRGASPRVKWRKDRGETVNLPVNGTDHK